MSDKFHDYLYGAKLLVRMDNNHLTYVQTTTKLNATGQRWMTTLTNYEFKLQYRPGRVNTDADSQSGHSHISAEEDGDWVEIPSSRESEPFAE